MVKDVLEILWGWLQTLRGRRLSAIDEVNAVMTALPPRELARVYVQPDLQPYNPANSAEEMPDEEDEEFRVSAFRWVKKFLAAGQRRDGRHVAFVLSDAGMGKTSLLSMLRMRAPQWKWGTRFRLFKLGPTTLEDIKAIERPVKTVLLLDSLDEDPTAHGRIGERIEEILHATLGFRQVLVTCRTQFFPLKNEFERDGARIKIGGFTCKTIYLSPFSDKQVSRYLKKHFRSDKEKVRRARELLGKIRSLRMRPMLLAYVDDLLKQEEEGRVKEWTLYATYQAMVAEWLDREERKPGSQVRASRLLNLSCILALELQKEGRREMSPEELGGRIEKFSKFYVAPDALSQIDNFGGRSLLNLNADGAYRFAHYSIQEYLVVQQMATYPREMESYSREIHYSDELVAFLVDWSKQAADWKPYLSGADLSGADLSGADLSDSDLSGADLSGADLSDADLSNANLKGANLSGAYLDDAYLSGADLTSANLRTAELVRTNLNSATLIEADLNSADLRDSNLAGANLMDVGLSGADLSGADLSETWITSDLQGTVGSSSTVLPDYLSRPKNWK